MIIHGVNLRKANPSTITQKLTNGYFRKPSAKDQRELQNTAITSVKNGVYILSMNTILIGLFFNYTKTIKGLKKSGALRYSNFIGKKCILKQLLEDLIEQNKTLNVFTDEDLSYINSVVNLSFTIGSYKRLTISIQQEIDRFKSNYKGRSLIKSLMAFTDYLFLYDYQPGSINDVSDINQRPKEDISSAISYLIFFISNRQKIRPADILLVSEDYILNGEIGKIIILACLLSDLKDFELRVEHFGYRCEVDVKKATIIPSSEEFEKSIRLGFIRHQIQGINDTSLTLEQIKGENLISIENIVENLSSIENLSFFKVSNTHGYSRYVIEIPEPIYDKIIQDLFIPNILFKEEQIYLAKAFKEQLLTLDDLENIKIQDNLSLLEFIKIHRVFILFFNLFKHHLNKTGSQDEDLTLRSLIPVYDQKAFYNLIEKFTSIENIDSYLDVCCWEPELDVLFDIQYHPILFFNESFMISLSVLANSNYLRNLFASEYKKNNPNLLKDGSNDRLVDKLSSAFSRQRIINLKQVPLPNGEIDLVVIYGKIIFFFECKHSLHPASFFDLRTTFDHIKKAETQLDYINKVFQEKSLNKIIMDKYQIDLSEVEYACSSIVVSNRMFNGDVFRYTVRNINEIENLLNEGVVRTKDGEFLLWETNCLSLNDLTNYFGRSNQILDLMYSSLSCKREIYDMTNPEIEFQTYYLDIDKADNLMEKFTSGLRKLNDE